MDAPREKTFRRGIKISILQQAAIILLAMLILDGGRLLNRMVGGAMIAWIGILLCVLLTSRPTWNEVHGFYFAKWCYVAIASIIFVVTCIRG